MTTHLTQEELILAYYGEPDLGARSQHPAECAECREELAKLAAVLDRVTPAEIPEPDAGFESRTWDRLSWRLRAEPRARRRRMPLWLAAAAVVVIAIGAAALLMRRDTTAVAPAQQQAASPATQQEQRDRILLVVVGDHFEQSERMLVELTNLTPGQAVDLSGESARAEELLASNRIYRQTATDRGEEQVATLLDELEPILMQIAHAPEQLGDDELRSIQRRVENKGLVFKLRVVRAGVRATAAPHHQQPTI